MLNSIKTRFASLRVAVPFSAMLALAACGDLPVATGGGSSPSLDANGPVPVALLIPSGSGDAGDQVLARSLQNAAELAVSDLQGVEIDLRIYGTAGDPSRAAAVASQAVNEGAKIIVGPLYGAAANAAGAAVAAQGVNVLAFSNNTDIAGGNVFLLGNTFENTADRLVSYAVRQDKERILVVSARDVAEQKGRAAILSAASEHGATIVGQTDFELSQNGVVEAVPQITASAQSGNAEAVFFTSGTAGALPIVTQLLADNGLSSASAQYIGLQRWDIPDQARSLGPLQGGWFAIPAPGPAAQFRERYTARFGAAPHPIAGVAYDGIAAVGALAASNRRQALSANRLTQSTGFAGVNGVFRLRADGTNERGLAIATLRNNQLVVIDPAPRSFGGAGF